MDKYRTLRDEIVKYKGVIFDLDETLVDLKVDWNGLKEKLSETIKSRTGEEMEFTPLDQRVGEVKGRFGEEIFSQLLEIISEYELHEKTYKINRALLEIYESLDGKKTAVYSMNTQKCVDNFVRKYFRRKPDILITKDSCIEPKPTEKDLKRILEEWHLLPKEVIYIGNSEKDKISGELANIKTYIISID